MFHVITKDRNKQSGRIIARDLERQIPKGKVTRERLLDAYNGDWTSWAVGVMTDEQFDATAEIEWKERRS